MPNFHILGREPPPRRSLVLKINNCHTLAQQGVQKWGIKTHFQEGKCQIFSPWEGNPLPDRPQVSRIYENCHTFTQQRQGKNCALLRKKGTGEHTFSNRKCQIFSSREGNPLLVPPQFIRNQ